MTALHPTDDFTRDQGQSSGLTCQWCSVRLPEGKAICPTCGSAGIPDLSLSVPGTELFEPPMTVEPQQPRETLDEWWLEDDGGAAAIQQPRRTELFEDRLFKTVGILAACAVVCAFIGWLAGPPFLAPLMENITGTPVEDTSDLRPMGTILGLLTGLFFGAALGWVFQAER